MRPAFDSVVDSLDEVYAMQDGFPHVVAIGLGLAFAFGFSLLVFAAWGGLLH